MKRILFLLSICLGGLVNAQTSYKIASIEGKPNIINQEDYDFVQKIITQKPIHIHTDSKGHLFTICWNGPETIYTIIGPKGEKIKSGKIDGNIKVQGQTITTLKGLKFQDSKFYGRKVIDVPQIPGSDGVYRNLYEVSPELRDWLQIFKNSRTKHKREK